MRLIKRFFAGIDSFLFAKREAWGFGMMRAAWASVAFTYFLRQWVDVDAYYSDTGFLPRDLVWMVTRSEWRFSVLDYGGTSAYVWGWYLAMLGALAFSALGVFPRLSTVASFLLMASFHERDAMTLGGGDTVLRNVGFVLAVSPGIHAFSLPRLRAQYASWRKKRALLPPVTMPSWPYRLLLWQLIVIYISSMWWKLYGDMWWNGTAVGAALHHKTFINWPYGVINYLMPFAALATWGTLLWEATWLLLLVPRPLARRLVPDILRVPVRGLVVLGGVAFHGSIALIMDVGVFPFAIFAGYLGLLDESQRGWWKRLVERFQRKPIVVLYDGSCRLCRRSAFILALLDAFKHLKLVDFRDEAAKKKVAPHLDESQLDLAMHILLPGQRVKTGYDAFRHMAWHLPALWPAAPFLYLPGISHLGRRIYAWVAENRQKCTHDRC